MSFIYDTHRREIRDFYQRFGYVISFTDPDPTQKPKADPDPRKSTSYCVKKQKEKNVRILPSGHNQISAVICRQ